MKAKIVLTKKSLTRSREKAYVPSEAVTVVATGVPSVRNNSTMMPPPKLGDNVPLIVISGMKPVVLNFVFAERTQKNRRRSKL